MISNYRDGKLINFLSYYFNIEIIYIGAPVSMNDMCLILRQLVYACAI